MYKCGFHCYFIREEGRRGTDYVHIQEQEDCFAITEQFRKEGDLIS